MRTSHAVAEKSRTPKLASNSGVPRLKCSEGGPFKLVIYH